MTTILPPISENCAKKIRGGFTFIEVLLVIGLLGFLVALAIPFYQGFQVSSELDNVTHEIIQTIRLAQAKAMASQGYQPFGVHFEEKKFILFQGEGYNPVDPFNEETETPGVLSIHPDHGDIIFDRIKGTTTMTGSIIVRTNTGESRTITINELGVVNAP